MEPEPVVTRVVTWDLTIKVVGPAGCSAIVTHGEFPLRPTDGQVAELRRGAEVYFEEIFGVPHTTSAVATYITGGKIPPEVSSDTDVG
jgi:hypothetical protein